MDGEYTVEYLKLINGLWIGRKCAQAAISTLSLNLKNKQ